MGTRGRDDGGASDPGDQGDPGDPGDSGRTGDTGDMADVTALGTELLRLQRRRRHVYDGVRLENSAFRILWVLDDGAPRTLRQLAADLDLEQSTVNRQVNAAIDAGWLERFDVEGSASRLVRPSAAGAEAYAHDGRIRASAIRSALDALGPTQSRAVIEGFRALNDAWDGVLEREG